MGGGGDNLSVGHRAGVRAPGHQPGEVGHVHQIEGADVVGDGAHAGEVNDARVGAAAADDELGAGFAGAGRQRIVIDRFRSLVTP